MLSRLPLWGFMTGLAYWFWRFFSPRNSDLILENKVVIVTGASSGIGRALAMAFARRGAKVVLTARRVELLEEVHQEIEPYAGAALVIPADLLDEVQRHSIIDKTIEAFGHVDILVNNAGISGGGLFQDFDEERIQRIINTNLMAPTLLTRQILPHFLSQGSGAIVNIGSTAARVASPTFVAYCAAKHGLAALTDALRREVQGSGIHLMLALPGWTTTDMVPPPVIDEVSKMFPMEDPHEVAEAIVSGLVQGREELILGGSLLKASVHAERYAPIIHRIYWRFGLTRSWLEAMRHIPS